MKHAFKEWAVICQALAEGRQALILRKGGIAEHGGQFQVEQTRFWLYPTYVHQQQTGVKPEAASLLGRVTTAKAPEGVLRISHFAEVIGTYHVRDLAAALQLDHLHVWSAETVRSRFAYRQPGLYVLPVRVHRAEQPIDLAELPIYAGCRTWVELDRELETANASQVLAEEHLQDLVNNLNLRLKPVALA